MKVDGVAVPYRGSFTSYTFPCAGDYTITATLPGTSATWKSVAHVTDAFHVTNTALYPAGAGPHPLAQQNLTDGTGKRACGSAAPRPSTAPPSRLAERIPRQGQSYRTISTAGNGAEEGDDGPRSVGHALL